MKGAMAQWRSGTNGENRVTPLYGIGRCWRPVSFFGAPEFFLFLFVVYLPNYHGMQNNRQGDGLPRYMAFAEESAGFIRMDKMRNCSTR